MKEKDHNRTHSLRINSFTVDMEEWFSSSVLPGSLETIEWREFESRIEKPTLILLDLLKKYKQSATFFILGWIAEKYPDLVKEIENCGHEIASHGYNHRKITSLSEYEFEKDTELSLNILRNIVSSEVIGYRAAFFTITKQTYWALDILNKYGIEYDSSVHPVFYHPDYGVNDSPLLPFKISGLTEVPISCIRFGGISFPVSGGGYFRIYPYSWTKKFIKIINKSNRPFIFYLHPWELDKHQPVLNLNAWQKFRHYQNLNQTKEKLEQLLTDFKFISVKELLKVNYEFQI